MDEKVAERLKQRFQFDQWGGRSAPLPGQPQGGAAAFTMKAALDTAEAAAVTAGMRSLFVEGYTAPPDALPGWRLARWRRLPSRAGTVHRDALWQDAGGDPETALRLEVYECPSREAAHELVIELLANFQSPLIERRQEPPVGDVAFAAPGDTALLFARGNVVMVLANAGRNLVPVSGLAVRLDEDLASPPPAPAGTAATAAIQRFEAAATVTAAGAPAPLRLEPATGAEGVGWKLFCSSGEVVREGDHLAFHATEPGPAHLVAFSLRPDGTRAASRSLDLVVE